MNSVFFDAYELIPGAGKSIGIYNFVRHLVGPLARALPTYLPLVVVGNPTNRRELTEALAGAGQLVIEGQAAPSRVARQLWQTGGAALSMKRHQAQIYLGPRGFLPRGLKLVNPSARSLVICHDLIRLWYSRHRPGYFPFLEHRLMVSGLLHAATHADRIVTVSQATASDIAEHVPGHPPMDVVHCGVPFTTAGPRPQQSPYLFAVTSGLPHKNATGLLEAYAHYRQLAAQPLPMVVCGIADPNQPGVTAVRGLSDELLHAYYAHAEAVLFLSLTEGFGLPPLEALLHGVPVVCSNIAALREVTFGYATYVDPMAPAAVAQALVQVLSDGQKARDDSRKAAQLLRSRLSYEANAQGLARCIAKLAEALPGESA